MPGRGLVWVLALAAAVAAGWARPAAIEASMALGPLDPRPGGAPEQAPSRLPSVLDRQIEGLPTEPLDRFLRTLPEETQKELPRFDLRQIIFDPTRGLDVDPGRIAGRLAAVLWREVLANSVLLGQLLVLAVLCALLQNLGHSFGGEGVRELAFAVSFLVLLYLGLQSFRLAMEVGADAIDAMVSFMQALLPLLSTMVAAVGAVTTAALFHPILITVVSFVGTLVRDVAFPLVFFTTVLGVVGNFASHFPVSRLAGLLRQASVLLLGFFFTLFLGVMAVRGAIAPVVDGVGLRTAKFLTGAFVPVVGSHLAGALDVVVGGSMLIKNAIGAFGMMTIFMLAAFPIVKIFSILLVYRLATAAAQPVTDHRLVEALGALAGGVTLILACVLTTALMFFVAVTVLVSLGNWTAVIR